MKTIADFPKDTRPFEPRGAAIKAIRTKRREVLLSGPAGTGKSTVCLQKLHACARKYPGMRGLIVRQTRTSLTQTAMVTFERKVLPEGWLGTFVRFRTQEQQYEYVNGSILAVGGLDKPSKIMSSEYDICYCMEATEVSEEAWESITTRLRNGVMPYQQLIADCNPGPPTHWLKQRCDRGVTLMLESKHEDNPSVTREYLATLDALTGVRYLRLRKGIWAAAEGMVYEQWNSSIHKVSKEQLITWGILTEEGKRGTAVKSVYASVDWGYTNPGVILVWFIDGDGRMYLIREVYMTQKVDDWWVKQGQTLKAEYGITHFFCDPAEPAYITKFKVNGLNALEATNDITPGISAVQSRLNLAGDGRPRLYLYEYSLLDRDQTLVDAHKPFCSEGEILEYVWPKAQDGKPVKEKPVDMNNHALDCWRYMAMYLDSATANATYHLEAMRRRAQLAQQRRAG